MELDEGCKKNDGMARKTFRGWIQRRKDFVNGKWNLGRKARVTGGARESARVSLGNVENCLFSWPRTSSKDIRRKVEISV